MTRYSSTGRRIPGSASAVSLDGSDPGSHIWRASDRIAATYKNFPEHKTLCSCFPLGFRSSLGWLQLKALGYKDVRIYNGGWEDRGTNSVLLAVQDENPCNEALNPLRHAQHGPADTLVPVRNGRETVECARS